MSNAKRKVVAVVLPVLLAPVAAYAIYAGAGMRAAAQTGGVMRAPGLIAPVTITRDARDIPHIVAQNDHDLYFAQGYAEGSDRLFQMDLIRRFVLGRLAEVMGPAALPADEHARVAPIDRIVDAEWAHLQPRSRAALQAFSDGVNAAMQQQPLPAEFHLLLYKPEPWTPRDSLATAFSTVLDLIDDWDDVVRRDEVLRAVGPRVQQDLYSITDPEYDAPVSGTGIAPVPRLSDRGARSTGRTAAFQTAVTPLRPDGPNEASNQWALGAARSATGGALLANDPHLRLGIPGVWYLIDLRDPRMHVAGATLPGSPGVVLGHNENIAWGATNGTVVTEVVYKDPLSNAQTRTEVFHVRFVKDVQRTYRTTRHGFVIDTDGSGAYAVDWNAVRFPVSPLETFSGLNQAKTIADALRALRSYPGPPQNFVIAARDGTAAYHLAGLIPQDSGWGLRIHNAADPFYAFVPFDALPHVDASRNARVFTANNRQYGARYPYRLSAGYAAPYRAKRIEELLDAVRRHDTADLFAMQSDTLSAPERELARDLLDAAVRQRVRASSILRPYLDALQSWNGRFDPGSRAATLAYAFRESAVARLAQYNTGSAGKAYIQSAGNAQFVVLLRVLRERPRGWWPQSGYDQLLVSTLRILVQKHGEHLLDPWRQTGAVGVKHPLASLGLSFLNGGTLYGDGDAYSLHVLTQSAHSQSFRAVWDTADWNAGGIIIPSGESGEPASGHYTDLRDTWLRQKLMPLPFGDAAVRADARSVLTLRPR